MSQIRVLLVDDHQVVREGLRRMLELEEDIAVAGEAASVQEALTAMEAHTPDVVLLDIRMPGVDGLEATRRLTQAYPSCQVLILTMHTQYLAEAIQAGAAGYLLKDVKREELCQAIRAVHEGRSPLDLALSRELFAEFATLARETSALKSSLSPREQALMRLIASGASTREMAAQLFISEATVKRGVQQLLERLNVHNRSEAVSEAHKRGLL